MPTVQQFLSSNARVHDLPTLVNALLRDTLEWPIADKIDDSEDITFGLTAENLKALDLKGHLLDGQIWPFRAYQPWGIFLVEEYFSESGLPTSLFAKGVVLQR